MTSDRPPPPYTSLRKREYLVLLGIFLILSVVLVSLKVIRIDERQGDTARYFETVENIADGKGPISAIDAGYNSVTLSTLLGAHAASGPLPATRSIESENFLRYHAYFILYLIAPLAKFIRTDIVLLSFDVLSFTGLVFLAYRGLRAKAIPVIPSSLFCLLIISHPAWSESLLLGQFYPDRFFMFAGFLFMYLASRAETKRISMMFAGIFCALIHERAALISGAALVLYTALHWRDEKNNRYFKVALGAGLLIFAVLEAKFVITSQGAYSGYLPGGFGDLIARFHDPVFASKAGVFALVNCVLLVIAIFDWRSAVIAAIVMLPNFIGSVGGAEKDGWSTHYHSFYFPILVWAALRGFIVAYEGATSRGFLPAFYPAVIALVIFLNSIDPYSALQHPPKGLPCTVFPTRSDAAALCPGDPHPNISIANIKNNFFVKLVKMKDQFLNREGLNFYALGNEISSVIPAKSVVSTVEAGMPYVYQNRRVEVFPEGIDRADFAIVAVLAPTDTAEADFRDEENWSRDRNSWLGSGGAISGRGSSGRMVTPRAQPLYFDPVAKTPYGGVFFAIAPPRQLQRINNAIMERMQRDGYNFDRPKVLPGLGLVVLKRTRSERRNAGSQ